MRLLFAVQPLEARGQRPRFAFQRPLEPLKHATLANVLNGLGAARKGVGNLLVGPRRPVGIGLQENLRPAYLLTAPLELADRLSTDLAFLVGESNDVLFLWHVELSRLETSFPIVLMSTRDAALASASSKSRRPTASSSAGTARSRSKPSTAGCFEISPTCTPPSPNSSSATTGAGASRSWLIARPSRHERSTSYAKPRSPNLCPRNRVRYKQTKSCGCCRTSRRDRPCTNVHWTNHLKFPAFQAARVVGSFTVPNGSEPTITLGREESTSSTTRKHGRRKRAKPLWLTAFSAITRPMRMKQFSQQAVPPRGIYKVRDTC